MRPKRETRDEVRALTARLRALLDESNLRHEAVTFVDEEGETNTLSEEFTTASMGHILLNQGRRDEARAVFHAALERDPHDEAARLGMTLLGDG